MIPFKSDCAIQYSALYVNFTTLAQGKSIDITKQQEHCKR